MAALDVEHEVPSVQVLHHKEQVLLLGTHRQRQSGLKQGSDHILVPSVGDSSGEVWRGTDVKDTIHLRHSPRSQQPLHLFSLVGIKSTVFNYCEY